MKRLALPFAALAGLGLALSALVHVTAAAGVASPLGRAAWGLHGGIFVVWLPTVLAARRLAGATRRRDFWQLALRGAPPWMRYMAGGFFAYALLSFALFASGSYGESKGNELVTLRGFSGHWMAFYSAALVTLYSYAHIDTTGRRCTNQHLVSPTARFCEECGQPIQAP